MPQMHLPEIVLPLPDAEAMSNIHIRSRVTLTRYGWEGKYYPGTVVAMPKKGDCSDCSGDGWAMREGGKSGTHKLRRCRTCNMDKKTPKPRYTIRMGGGSYEGDELQEVLKGDGHTLLAHGV